MSFTVSYSQRLVVTKTGSQCELVNNGGHSVDAAVLAQCCNVWFNHSKIDVKSKGFRNRSIRRVRLSLFKINSCIVWNITSPPILSICCALTLSIILSSLQSSVSLKDISVLDFIFLLSLPTEQKIRLLLC